MKHEDVRIGMKVVPHQKTAPGWGSLEKSQVWKYAKSQNQPYLYVTGFDEDENAWALGDEPVESLGGDFFLSEDFEIYTGEYWLDNLVAPSKAELAMMDANAEELRNDFIGELS